MYLQNVNLVKNSPVSFVKKVYLVQNNQIDILCD